MITTIDYSLLAGASYYDTRDKNNRTPVPQGWNYLSRIPQDTSTGFEVVAFERVTNGVTEIVISFAGTYPKDVTGDIAADIGLALGQGSEQLTQALDYYLAVKATNSNALITLTGHSLGGGLAALVGIFFGVETHTFDQAPFAVSAKARTMTLPDGTVLNVDVATVLRQHLADETGLTADQAIVRDQMLAQLDGFLTQRAATGGIPNSQYVTNINIKGEFLSGVPWNAFNRIGSTIEDIDFGNTDLAGDQLHDMALLATTKLNPSFLHAAKSLPNFLKLLFDSTLYWEDTDQDQPNLLYQLVRHQVGVRDPDTNTITVPADGMLDHFVSDLQKLFNAGGPAVSDANLNQALITFLLQAYHNQDAGFTKELFQTVSGGLSFDRTTVVGSEGTMKGYSAFQAWLGAHSDIYSDVEMGTFNGAATEDREWFIATQETGMNASAGATAALMLGSAGIDQLTGGGNNDFIMGGTGNDALSGEGGNDLLMGGGDADTLMGGTDFDTYYAGDGDEIKDADDSGSIIVGGVKLTGGRRSQNDEYYVSSDKKTIYRESANGVIDAWVSGAKGVEHLVIRPTTGTHRVESENETATGIPGMGVALITDKDQKKKDPPFRPPFNQSKEVVCPLVLDLDGNGVTITPAEQGVYFDHNGDGLAEKSAWISAADGFLVRDRNGDGKIMSGDELFGDQTRMKDGRWGQNGFDVLAEYDDNQDGKIDSQDAIWGDLKVWRDATRDGISQADELYTLSNVDIQSIGVVYSQPGGADTLSTGHYTKTDGSTGNNVDDPIFQSVPWDTRSNDTQAIPDDIARLPELQGYGKVVSLQQAMAKDNGLKALVEQFAVEPTRAGREAVLGQILLKWTHSEDIDPHSRKSAYYRTDYDARKLNVIEQFNGEGLVQANADSGQVETNPLPQAIPLLDQAYKALFEMMYTQLMAQTPLKGLVDQVALSWDSQADRVKADATQAVATIGEAYAADPAIGTAKASEFARVLFSSGRFDAADMAAIADQIDQLGPDVAQAVNRVAEKLPKLILTGTASSDMLDGSAGYDLISGGAGNDLLRGGYGADYLAGDAGNDTLQGEVGNDSLYGGNGDDTLTGGSDDDTLNGGSDNDTYVFNNGNGQDRVVGAVGGVAEFDVVEFGSGIRPEDIVVSRSLDGLTFTVSGTTDSLTVDSYFSDQDGLQVDEFRFSDGTSWGFDQIKAMLPPVATEGDDQVLGFNTNDVLDGKGGSDVIFGQGGQDTLTGGAGNDILKGGTGDDTYLFGRGDGQDTIWSYDANQTKQDVVQFKAGVTTADVAVSRNGDNLILKIADTQDQLMVQNYFYNDDSFNPYGIEAIRFDDGTSWEYVEIKAKTLVATEGDDYLVGSANADSLAGSGGNDTLYGRSGNDTLDGGVGNDYMNGQAGNDTYLFGRGDGQDTISSYDGNQNQQDVVQFKAGVTTADVAVNRNGDSLILKIADTQDQLTIQNYFYNDGSFNPCGIEAIRFDDGTSWNYVDVKNILPGPTTGDDALYGYGTDDVISGLGV
jgi:Ca2+-binding RTX toxin-like protein